MFNIQPSGIYFYTVIIAFMGGVILRSFADLGLWLGLLLLVIGGAIAAMSFALMGGKNVVLIALVVVAVGVGVTRLEVADKKEFVLQEWVGQKIALSAAVVVNEPDVRDKHQQLTVLSDGLPGRILVLTELFPQYRYGDKISIQGHLEEPASFEVNTGRVFDYPAYLAKDGIYFQMFYPRIEIISRGEGGSAIKQALFGLKNAFMDNIRLVLPEPHASLLGGLLLGIKRSLGADLLDDFRAVGLIHIVVLSGYYITIIADFIGRLLASLRSLRARLALSAIAIVLFVILTGGSATTVVPQRVSLL
jgi:competence protein ComEC